MSIDQLFELAAERPDEESLVCGRSDERLDQALGFGNGVTEREILQMYGGSHETHERALRAVFVLRLAVALLEYGQNTVDAELMLRKVSHSLGLPSPHLNLGARTVQISFGSGPAHLLNCSSDLLVDKLLEVSALCRYIAHRGDVDAAQALWVLDHIIQQPLPYGWLVQLLNLECVCSWAALAAFMGSWSDMAAAAIIAPFALLTRQFCIRNGLASLELVLCSLVVGVVTPLVWKYVVEVPLCHVTNWWGCALLLYLPGCELIYGAYEIKYGSLVNGASQLISALVRCMLMGIGLTIGWQVFGRDAASQILGQGGAAASMVPAQACDGPGPSDPSWQFVFGVLNFPMLFHCFVSLNMRLTDAVSTFCVAYPSLFVFMALVQAGTFPSYVTDAIGIFMAASLASALERWNGTPVCVSVVPMVIILAPGWPSVRSVLMSMQKGEHLDVTPTSFWTDLALQGAAYAVGLSLALGMFRAWHHRQTCEMGTEDEREVEAATSSNSSASS